MSASVIHVSDGAPGAGRAALHSEFAARQSCSQRRPSQIDPASHAHSSAGRSALESTDVAGVTTMVGDIIGAAALNAGPNKEGWFSRGVGSPAAAPKV